MNRHECAKVLAKIQLGDNRQVDQLVLDEWFDTISDLQFEDAIEAVRIHRRESTAYLVAAHVVANVKRIREQRALIEVAECPCHPGYPAAGRFPCYACEREQEWTT